MSASAASKDSSKSSLQNASGNSALTDLPEVAAFKRRRRRILWAIAGVLLISGSAAEPAYKVVKHWRCVKLAKESADLLERREMEQAFSRARAAHQLLPEEPEALRAMARVLSARNDWSNACAFWAEVVKRDAKAEDRRLYADASLHTGALPVAMEQLSALLASDPGSAENHLLAAKVHLAQRNATLAVQDARKAVELDPANEPAVFALCQLLLQIPDSRDEGLQRLHQLAETKTSTGLLALGVLAGLPASSEDEVMQLARALREHPLAEEVHRLKALELELRGAPEARAERLDKAEKQYASAEPEALRAFASWLSSQGEPARTLKVLSQERAFSRKDLLLVRLDAMAALGQWREILAVLGKDRVPLEPAFVHLYKARCWKELKDNTQSDIAWRAAHAAAAGDLNTLLYVAGYAEKVGAREHAERTYRTLAQNPKTARFAYEALLRLTPRADTAGLRNTLAEMVQRWPKDVALANDLAYLSALLSIDVTQNREKARELVAAAPESLPHRTVLALTELREGNAAAALQVYDGLRIDWRSAAPGSVVVYASALHQMGRTEEAKTLVATLSANTLRPEEQTLLAAINKS